jgi:transcriptional regulator with XRE-family HTH domain
MDLVLRLREFRRFSCLHQGEVARRAGIGVKTLSSFESGARIESMKVSQLQRILRVYGVTEAQFFASDLETSLGNDGNAKLIPRSEKLKTLPLHVRRALIERFELMIESALLAVKDHLASTRAINPAQPGYRSFSP